MEKEIILKTNHITKYYYEPVKFKALDNVSFEIRKGEFLTITGKSGCGKTTLMYILSTMDTDYEGELFIAGEKITHQKQDKLAAIRNKNIGFVFQFHYLLPEFTCLKNVMIPALKLKKYTYDEIEYQAYKKLELLGIKEQALKPASKISGGQQQRVAIARALINEPKIIMGDEPTGNLDSKNSNIVLDIFHQLAADYGQTIITVTHDNDFASKSHRNMEMADGIIINHGRKNE
ncbi:MAG: ABC transporter ATP-binding protein [Bacteroidales bacterium]|nr:ABC transporter ATP-binding protein [Bacteroidales bacterium]